MECPFCGGKISRSDVFCPNCSKYLSASESSDGLRLEGPEMPADDNGVGLNQVLKQEQSVNHEAEPQDAELSGLDPTKLPVKLYPPAPQNGGQVHNTEPKAAPAKESAHPSKKSKSASGLHFSKTPIAVLAACVVIFVIGLIMLISGLSLQIRLNMARTDLAEEQDKNTNLTEENSSLDAEVTRLQNYCGELSDQVESLQSDLTELQNSVNQNTYDAEAAERDLTQAKVRINELENSLSQAENSLARTQLELTNANASLSEANTSLETLQASYDELSASMDTLQGQYDTLSAQYDTLTSDYNTLNETADFYINHAVLVDSTASSGYYHKYTCANAPLSGYLIYNIRLAESEGFTPCPICFGDEG